MTSPDSSPNPAARTSVHGPSSARRPLRIVHVMPTYFPALRYGGPIFAVHQLAVAQARAGHAVTALTTNLDGDGVLDVPVSTPVDVEGVRVRYFPCSMLPRLTVSWPMARAFRRELLGADIVHFSSLFSFPTSMGAAVARRLGVPYVVEPHGSLVPELIGRQGRGRKQLWLALFDRATLRGAAALHVSASAEYASALATGYPIPPAMTIPNGIVFPPEGALHQPHPVLAACMAKAPYVLFLGRLSWKKGIDRLLRALPGAGLRLIVAGNDDEGIRPELERLIRDLSIESLVDFVGPVRGDDKWALFAGARCFALTSHNENFGNAVAEAMAMGCPVVVTDTVGASEHVRAAGGGIVVEQRERAIHDALATLALDTARAQRLGSAGRAYTRSTLSVEANAAAVLEHYQRILDVHRRRAP